LPANFRDFLSFPVATWGYFSPDCS